MLGDSWGDPRTMATLNLAAGLLGGGNFGQALGRGLQGYSSSMQGAEESAARKEDRALKKIMSDMQLEELMRKRNQEKGQQQWRQELTGVMAPQLQGQTEQAKMLLDQFGPDASPDDVNAMNSGARMPMEGIKYAPDQAALQRHLLDPRSPFADKLLEQQFMPKEPKYTVVDGSLVRTDTATPTVAFTAPAKPKGDPTKVQEFEYAKKNGYKGTFEQYVTLGPTITAGAMAGLRDAQIANIFAENAYNLPTPTPRPAGGGGVTVTAPDGSVYSFPSQAAANQFKSKAGIK